MSALATVAICTKDRPEDLRRTLQILLSTHASCSSLQEVIVVDNSAAGTARDVVSAVDLTGSHSIRYIHQPQPGISIARARALREALSEVLIFLDDDMDVSLGYVEAHCRTFEDFDVGVSLGRILPDLAAVKQEWLAVAHREMLGGPSGRLDLGSKPKRLPDGPAGFGGNTAIRLSCVPAELTFPSALGWDPDGARIGGEDTYFFGRLAEIEGSAYTPQASVVHRVPAERLGPDYFRVYFTGSGRASTRMALINKGRSRTWLLLILILQSFKWLRYRCLAKALTEKRWIRMRKRHYAGGKVLEAAHLLLHPEAAKALVRPSSDAERQD